LPVTESPAGTEQGVRQIWKIIGSVMTTVGFILVIRFQVVTPPGKSIESSHEAHEEC